MTTQYPAAARQIQYTIQGEIGELLRQVDLQLQAIRSRLETMETVQGAIYAILEEQQQRAEEDAKFRQAMAKRLDRRVESIALRAQLQADLICAEVTALSEALPEEVRERRQEISARRHGSCSTSSM